MYKRPRIIPVLTMQHMDLVKTQNFKNPRYIGDPINSVRIFNNKNVDEMCILDITATKEKRSPDFDYLKEIASEAFMPLGYGGGIESLDHAKKIFRIGYEKVIVNTLFWENPDEVKKIVEYAGSQSVVLSIDYKKNIFGKRIMYSHDGTTKRKESFEEIEKIIKEVGVGELIITSIDNEGMMKGYELDSLNEYKLDIPIVINGGAGNVNDIKRALEVGADAVAASSMFVFYGDNRAVLINTPEEKEYYILGIYED